jgi:hypothetical protein
VGHTQFEKVEEVFVFEGQHGRGILHWGQRLLEVVLGRDGLLIGLGLQLVQQGGFGPAVLAGLGDVEQALGGGLRFLQDGHVQAPT